MRDVFENAIKMSESPDSERRDRTTWRLIQFFLQGIIESSKNNKQEELFRLSQKRDKLTNEEYAKKRKNIELWGEETDLKELETQAWALASEWLTKVGNENRINIFKRFIKMMLMLDEQNVNAGFMRALEDQLMHNTYYVDMFELFTILEVVDERTLLSDHFVEVMINHAFIKLETGTCSDLIQLGAIHNKRFTPQQLHDKLEHNDVLERMKSILVQEINMMPLEHITLYLDFYERKNDILFSKFILK